MMLTRRQFLQVTAAAPLLAGVVRARTAQTLRRKALFRVLYSNDTTNILSCISPFHKAREPFRKEMLEATVDEVAGTGVDAHLLQPGVGWVPWWPSKVYPMAEHAAWMKQRYGAKLDSFAQFVLDGGDIVQVFLDRCRLRGQAPFISFRLNDGHHKEWVNAKPGDKIPASASQTLTPFYAEHPEYRIGPDINDWAQRVQNWAIPEVREHKFVFLRELCENYDLDGLELDFLRNYSYFDLAKTDRDQRCAIMTGFVRQARELLDRTERDGRRRWLCARVPMYLEALDRLGLDLPAMVAAGLDMVNASSHYFTTQRHDFAAIRRQAPDATVYFEMCHSTWNGPRLSEGYDAFAFRRTTPEQYYTTAHHAYSQGADGISAFNFVYYREHGGAGRGTFAEPPFHIFKRLRDPQWLARQPQHWFLAPGWRAPDTKPPPVPRTLESTETAAFTLHLVPPANGWGKNGRLRLQFDSRPVGDKWCALFNETELSATNDVSEPYPNPYPALLGLPEQLRSWIVPASLFRAGPNRIEVKSSLAKPTSVVFLDLAVE
jgi:hypothetical protein